MGIDSKYMVSIVVPVFNREKYVSDTIQSVIDQENNNWELILVDDGSIDQSKEICKRFATHDSRIKFIERNIQPKGASVCRNIGWKNAKYDWVIFLDSDDLLASWCIQNRIEKISSTDNNKDFVVFPMLYFKNKVDDMMILQNINTKDEALDRFLQRENVWLMSSVIWSKKFLSKLGGYNQNALSFQDWEINVRALIYSDNWVFYDKMTPDNFYRQHSDTISKDRFTVTHICNNLDTFLNCYSVLKDSIKLSEIRKHYFSALVFEWLSRLSGLKLSYSERNEIREDYFNSYEKIGLLSRENIKLLRSYFMTKDNRILFRINFLKRWMLNNKEEKLPEYLFQKIKRNQGLHKYEGSLN